MNNVLLLSIAQSLSNSKENISLFVERVMRFQVIL